jgi:cryptochrome
LSITKLNSKSKLFVLREAPQTLFAKLFKKWKPTHLVFEKDTDAYARERDEVVMKLARDAGVEVITKYGRTLWDSDEIVSKHDGKPTMSITQLQAAGKKVGQIPKPIPAPTSLPDPGEMPVDFDQSSPEADPDINAKWRDKDEKAYTHIAGPKGDFAIETLEELGYPAATSPHRGGETLALAALEEIMADQPYAATFRKPRTSPAAFEPQSTTLLSPHMHFGSLSVRLFYWRAQDAVDAYKKSGGKDASGPPESLTGQLLFRDMYFAAQAAIGATFNQTANNAHCRFIPWHLPSKLDEKTGQVTFEYTVDSAQADAWFRRWRAGMTGFPWIDALMRQLRAEGWIHHLGRHSVACFLTRGGCYIDWERGAEVFEELLLDHEPACNAGNWQWLSCTAFFSQYYRCYSPISFGQKWDREGAFVRHWVPELKKLDARYIYEPWKTPLSDQKKAGVRITGDGMGEAEEGTYPKPMFDFAERRRVCLASMKKAYEVGLYGDDKRVLDGSWKELFEAGDDGLDMMGPMDSDDGEGADVAGNEDLPTRGKAAKAVPAKRDAKQGTLDRHFKKHKT